MPVLQATITEDPARRQGALLKREASNQFTAGFVYPEHLLEFDPYYCSSVSIPRWYPGWDLNPHDLAAKGF